MTLLLALTAALPLSASAFVPTIATTSSASTRLRLSSTQEEAQRLLEKARQMRQEVAALEGRTLEQVEEEAARKKQQLAEIEAKKRSERNEQKQNDTANKQDKNSGRFLTLNASRDPRRSDFAS